MQDCKGNIMLMHLLSFIKKTTLAIFATTAAALSINAQMNLLCQYPPVEGSAVENFLLATQKQAHWKGKLKIPHFPNIYNTNLHITDGLDAIENSGIGYHVLNLDATFNQWGSKGVLTLTYNKNESEISKPGQQSLEDNALLAANVEFEIVYQCDPEKNDHLCVYFIMSINNIRYWVPFARIENIESTIQSTTLIRDDSSSKYKTSDDILFKLKPVNEKKPTKRKLGFDTKDNDTSSKKRFAKRDPNPFGKITSCGWNSK